MARKAEVLLRVEPEKLDELRALSKRLRVPQAELMRVALDRFLERYGDAEFGQEIK